MADNFSYGIKSLQKLSEMEIKDVNKFENDNFESKMFDTESDEDVSDYEKQIIGHKAHLEQRLKDLQNTMIQLRKQLAEEKYMWKKQLEETIVHAATCECHANILESNEYNTSENMEILDDTEPFSKDLSATDYEETLVQYQEAIVKAQAEKRASLRRQISINNYKRRLLEVENMCNLELLRVKQNVQFLQPLQLMASEWNINNRNKNMNSDEEITGVQQLEFPKRDESEVSNGRPEEATYTDTSDKKMCGETNSVFPRMPYCSVNLPQVASNVLWQFEDDFNGVGPTNNMCYTPEFLASPIIAETNPF